jgi:hypothetical protein
MDTLSAFLNIIGDFLVGNRELITLAVATLALLISLYQIFFTRGHYKRQIGSTKLRQTLDFLNEWRQPEFKETQFHILNIVSQKLVNDPTFRFKGYRYLDKDDKKAVQVVSYFFDYSGNISGTNYLDTVLLLTMLARPILDHWNIISPLLIEGRKIRQNIASSQKMPSQPKYKERYQAGFEHLAAEAYWFSQRRALKLKSMKFEIPVRSPVGYD